MLSLKAVVFRMGKDEPGESASLKGRQGHIWCHDGKECCVINVFPQGSYYIMYMYQYFIHYLYIFLAMGAFL